MEYAITILSALADPIRLRSLALMVREKEVCVCELTHALHVSQPTVSKHLATLREAGLVRDRRDAQWVMYSIATDLPPWAVDALMAAARGMSDSALHAEDVERLQSMVRPPRLRSA